MDDRTLIGSGDRTQVIAGERTQAVPAAGAGVRCPVCETPNAAGEVWCIECGFRLDATPGDIPAADQLAPPAYLRDDDGATFPIRPGLNTLGRADAAILVADPTVSRRHAQIGLEEGHLWIEDLGSSNGTLVNGVRLNAGQRKELEGGEKLQFGSKSLQLEIDRPDQLGQGSALQSASETEVGEATALQETEAGEAAMLTEPVGVEAAAPAEDASAAGEASRPAEASAAAAGEPAASPEETEPQLILSSGERVPLPEGVTTVGRRGDNDLVIPDAYTSGSHAQIIREGPALFLVDVGSTNGTTLNGERLAPGERVPLNDGDAIVFGQVTATFHSPRTTG